MTRRRSALAALMAGLALAATALVPSAGAQDVEISPGGELATFTARVTGIVNAETIKVRTASGRTRIVELAGVDSPLIRRNGDVECGALGALDALVRKAFTKPRDTDGDGLKDAPGGSGRKVTVSTDPGVSLPGGRLWAYVEPTGKGGQFNVTQLLGGWATIKDRGASLAQGSNLAAAKLAAQSSGAGVWGACNGDFHVDGSVIY